MAAAPDTLNTSVLPRASTPHSTSRSKPMSTRAMAADAEP